MTTTWHENLTGWHKSSYTHWEENACVEIGGAPGVVGIRDTKQWALPDETRPILVLPAASFTALLDHLGR